MKALCRYAAIFIVSLIALTWIALQTDLVQLWARAQVITRLEKATGYHVTVSEVGGVPPLFMSLENIEFFERGEDAHHLPTQKKMLSIGSFECVPAWFDLVIGRVSFLYVRANDIDLTHLAELQPSAASNIDSLKALFPNTPLSAYAISLSNISMPLSFSEPLLNDFHDEQELNISYNVHGKIHWHPHKESLYSSLTISPLAARTTLGSLKLGLNIAGETAEASLDIKAVKAPAGSIFITLPADQLTFECDLAAKTSELFHQTKEPLLTGKWHLSGLTRANKQLFSSFLRFAADGTLSLQDLHTFSFATTAISCNELVPDMNVENPDRVDFLMSPHENLNRGFLAINKAITGTLQGTCRFGEDEIACELNSDTFRFENSELQAFSSSFAAQKKEKRWHGSFALDTSFRRYGKANWLPIKAAGTWDTDGHIEWDFPELKFAICDYPIEGNLHVALYPLAMQGRLANRSSDASRLAKQLGFDPQGKANLSIDVAESIKIALEASDFQIADFSKIKLDLHSNILLDGPSPFSLHVDSENKNQKCALQAEGTLGLSNIHVDTLTVDVENNTFKNDKPIDLKFSPVMLDLEAMELRSDKGGSISAQWKQTEKAIQASLTTDNLSLKTFNPFLQDAYLFGSLSGHVEVSGPLASPQISTTFASSEWRFARKGASRSAPLMTSGRMMLINGLFEGDVELQGVEMRRPIVCHVTLPLKLSLAPFSISVPPKSAIQASLKGEAQLESLLASLGKETDRLGGLAVIDVVATGTVSEPRFFGEITWNQGHLHIPYIGSEISNIQMKGKLDNEKLVIDHMSATDGKKGHVTGSGIAVFSTAQTFSYGLVCDFFDFEIISLDEAQVRTNGNAVLEGNLNEATLNGKAEVTNAILFISPNLSPPRPDLDITYINQEHPPVDSPKKFHFNLDLDISMPANGQISGMGLESEWKADMHLTGRDKNFQLKGKGSAIKGNLEFGHKQFALSHATIEFNGDPLTKSHLNIVASHHVSQIATQILLRGSLGSPRLDLQSTPAMSQKEIISWILFNKSSSEISPFEGVQLAQTLLKLQSNGQSQNVFEKLKSTIGIDRIGVGPASSVSPQQQDPYSNEVSVQVGKYLSDGVIVTLSKDVTNEVNRIGIEANITDNIIAEANVGDDSETQLSLQWKINY